jgi:predicted AAA+ superfamily ATPase
LRPVRTLPDLPAYVDLALAGGFPDTALRLSGPARAAWLDSYLDQLLTRDVASLTARAPFRLRRYFEALALNRAGTPEDKTLYDAAGIDRKTAIAYRGLLARLLVTAEIFAWLPNRLSRMTKAPKRYVVDPALIGAALRLDTAAVLRDGDLLGRLLDTFVVAQLRPEVAVSTSRPRLYHLREKNGRREIDLLAELAADRVVAVEVKATAAPSASDARHLAWLRDEIGERFVAGIVLHTAAAAIGSVTAWSPRRSPHCGTPPAQRRWQTGEHDGGTDAHFVRFLPLHASPEGSRHSLWAVRTALTDKLP